MIENAGVTGRTGEWGVLYIDPLGGVARRIS